MARDNIIIGHPCNQELKAEFHSCNIDQMVEHMVNSKSVILIAAIFCPAVHHTAFFQTLKVYHVYNHVFYLIGSAMVKCHEHDEGWFESQMIKTLALLWSLHTRWHSVGLVVYMIIAFL